MSALFVRKQLSAEGLLHTARQVFGKIPDTPGNAIALTPLPCGLLPGPREEILFIRVAPTIANHGVMITER